MSRSASLIPRTSPPGEPGVSVETDEGISKSVIEEINALHAELCVLARMTLAKAVRIGELLTQSKDALLHGEWVGWLKENVAFNVLTAQRYMRLYQHRDQFKNDTVSHLLDAYDRLSTPKKEKGQPLRLYTPAKPFLYDGYEYRIKPAYFGGYLVSINGGEYRNMGDTHNHAALLACEAIDVCSGLNLDLIRAAGEGMVGFETMPEATKTTKRTKSVKPVPAPDPKASRTGYRVSRLPIELAALKQLLENETSELTQEQLTELRNHAGTISALFKGGLITPGDFASARAAAIAVGTVKVKTPLEQLDFWWAQASQEEQRIFTEEKLTLQLLPEAFRTPIAPLLRMNGRSTGPGASTPSSPGSAGQPTSSNESDPQLGSSLQRRAEVAPGAEAERISGVLRTDSDQVTVGVNWEIPASAGEPVVFRIRISRGGRESLVRCAVDLDQLGTDDLQLVHDLLACPPKGYWLARMVTWLIDVSLRQGHPNWSTEERNRKVRELLLMETAR